MRPPLLLLTALLLGHTAAQPAQSPSTPLLAGLCQPCADVIRSAVRQELSSGLQELVETLQPPPEECPPGWSRHRDSCYFIPPQRTSWYLAHRVCAQLDRRARLASVHPDSSRFVEGLVEGFSAQKGVWIALTRLTGTADWVWTDGTPTDYVHWEPGQPGGGAEICGHHGWPGHSKTGWHDNTCSVQLNLLCKLDLKQA